MLRFLLILLCCVAAPTFAIELIAAPKISAQFSQAKVNGTFVMLDATAQRWIGHNAERAATRFSPASTFKIPNSLIGLATGAVSSVDEVFYHHDGQPKYLKSWEHDMGLRGALPISNVAAYQELARRIGLQPMQQQLDQLNYGNHRIAGGVDQFWLNGSLTISAVEQVQFLTRLAQGALPYPANMQAAVREITLLETGKNWKLYGKTGWTGRQQPSIGWFVGWVEQDGKLYTFALNMDIPDAADLPKRIEIAKASLRSQGLMQ
ncbi:MULTISPECIES: class D beta-lactamase [Deefgea]|uniref:Beta-lactamase n=1 Tax=Deefgea chitinilytica TaxID=570276 RepID=A0ABS2CEV6_9NEIS|nr:MULTISPECIES: class D beta-lactamase [Deefgea]MBM5572666.1 class D beta-lactamase [Deefgea chitinilytica]MBM9889902.1 class D beta-lactamase [Deefgea sp. CFH1-16]